MNRWVVVVLSAVAALGVALAFVFALGRVVSAGSTPTPTVGVKTIADRTAVAYGKSLTSACTNAQNGTATVRLATGLCGTVSKDFGRKSIYWQSGVVRYHWKFTENVTVHPDDVTAGTPARYVIVLDGATSGKTPSGTPFQFLAQTTWTIDVTVTGSTATVTLISVSNTTPTP